MTNLAHNLQATAGSHPHRIALRQGESNMDGYRSNPSFSLLRCAAT
jgi:hypothetical protein